MHRHIAQLVASCLSGWVCAIAAGQFVLIQPSHDNTLFEDAAGAISNGAGQHFFVGRTPTAALRRGLLRFDVASAVPAGAPVWEVTLRLNLSRTGVGPTTIGLHRALASWGEGTSDAPSEEGGGAPATAGDATWLHRFFDTEFWPTPGGDFVAQPSATLTVGPEGVYTWHSTPELLADVQAWIDDPASNFGWVLVADETSASTKRFDSRENPVASARPELMVAFAPGGCRGDLDGDSEIGLADLAILLSDFGAEQPPQPPAGDVDGDGDVDLADLSLLLADFGTICPP
jgi:hypothetical protein